MVESSSYFYLNNSDNNFVLFLSNKAEASTRIFESLKQ